MMLDELSLVLARVAPNATADAYISAIVDENILGKRTQTTRQRSAKRLTELYALDPACTVFRLLRHFWPADRAGQPMLAFLAAATRDPLLREATPFVLAVPAKAAVNATQIGEHLNQKYPARFRPTTLHSTAQNLASSWTQAGFLTGKVKKNRSRPTITPVVAAFAVRVGVSLWLPGKTVAGLDVDPASGPLARRTDRPGDRGIAAGLAQLQGGGERGGDHVPRPADATGREGRL